MKSTEKFFQVRQNLSLTNLTHHQFLSNFKIERL